MLKQNIIDEDIKIIVKEIIFDLKIKLKDLAEKAEYPASSLSEILKKDGKKGIKPYNWDKIKIALNNIFKDKKNTNDLRDPISIEKKLNLINKDFNSSNYIQPNMPLKNKDANYIERQCDHELLEHLKKYSNKKTNVCFIGLPKSGKTSLMSILEDIAKEKGIVFININFKKIYESIINRNDRNIRNIFCSMIEVIYKQISDQSLSPVKIKNIDEIKKDIEDDTDNSLGKTAVDQIKQVFESYIKETVKISFVLEEIDFLLLKEIPHTDSFFAGFVMMYRDNEKFNNVSFFSDISIEIDQTFNSSINALVYLSNRIYMFPFNEDEIKKLIRLYFYKIDEIKLNDMYKYIFDYTGGNPYLSHLIIDKIQSYNQILDENLFNNVINNLHTEIDYFKELILSYIKFCTKRDDFLSTLKNINEGNVFYNKELRTLLCENFKFYNENFKLNCQFFRELINEKITELEK